MSPSPCLTLTLKLSCLQEPLFEHMTRPLISRQVTPGAPDALDSEQLEFLRGLPGPKRMRTSRGGWRNRAMKAGDEVIAYWSGDKIRAAAKEPAAAKDSAEADGSISRASRDSDVSASACAAELSSSSFLFCFI